MLPRHAVPKPDQKNPFQTKTQPQPQMKTLLIRLPNNQHAIPMFNRNIIPPHNQRLTQLRRRASDMTRKQPIPILC